MLARKAQQDRMDGGMDVCAVDILYGLWGFRSTLARQGARDKVERSWVGLRPQRE